MFLSFTQTNRIIQISEIYSLLFVLSKKIPTEGKTQSRAGFLRAAAEWKSRVPDKEFAPMSTNKE